MNICRIVAALGASAALASAFPGTAQAQFGAFGQLNLPDNDFTWVWGDLDESRRGREDLSIRSTDSGFRCLLEARFAPGDRVSMQEERELEAALGTTLYFIQESAYAMSMLERQRDIDWATLECTRPKDNMTEAERQERLDELRERALRKSQRRLERRDRD